MRPLKSLQLAHKLPLMVVGFGLMVTVILIAISSFTFQRSAVQNTEDQFKTMLADRKSAFEALISDIRADVMVMANVPSTTMASQRLSAAWSQAGDDPAAVLRQLYITDNPNPAGERDQLDRGKGTIAYNIHHAMFHPSFRSLLESKGYYNAFLINQSGDILYNVTKEEDFGTNLLTGAYKDSNLADTFRVLADMEPGEVVFSRLDFYAPSGNTPSVFVGTKLISTSGQITGLLVLQVSVDMFEAVISDNRGGGETVEVVLVGPDFKARTSSRFEDGFSVLQDLPQDPYIESALNGDAVFYPETTGLRGQAVAAYSSPVSVDGINWAIVAQQDLSELMAPVHESRNLLIMASLVASAVLSFLGWLFARTITRPINQICDSMEQVSSGNLDTDVPAAARRDEIGKIGKTLLSMQEDLKSARTAEEQRAEQQREQEEVVNKLSIGLVRLANGDFSQPIEEAFPEGHEQLRSDFNRTLDTLNSTIQDVVAAAQSIRNGALEISQASDDLSHRTESQAATLEETAAALEQMTVSVKSAADGARSVEGIVNEAKSEAEDSGVVVQNAVSAMNEIEQSSRHISQIIGVIDDISFQTNLLALNAGVEAARAGDAGRGFAVVASEVRALAQRSSDAAMEIKTLIQDSNKQVEQGVDLVGKAGAALHNIVDRVGHISQLVSEIAEGASEQSTGLGEINIGVTQLDQVTQQNAAMVEEATAASHLLNTDSTRLAELVAHFKIKGGSATDFAQSSKQPEVHTAHGMDWDIEDEPAPAPMVAGGGGKSADLWQDF